MALTSASTAAQICAAYEDNCMYDGGGMGSGSPAMAALFVQACRILLRRLPTMSNQDRGGVTYNPQNIRAELDRAVMWQALNPANPGGGGGRYIGIDQLRDGQGSIPGINNNPDPGGTP